MPPQRPKGWASSRRRSRRTRPLRRKKKTAARGLPVIIHLTVRRRLRQESPVHLPVAGGAVLDRREGPLHPDSCGLDAVRTATGALCLTSNQNPEQPPPAGRVRVWFSVSRPDFDDCLRRSAAVLHKHVTVCDWRRRRAARDRPETLDTGQFRDSAARLFDEARCAAPRKRRRSSAYRWRTARFTSRHEH